MSIRHKRAQELNRYYEGNITPLDIIRLTLPSRKMKSIVPVLEALTDTVKQKDLPSILHKSSRKVIRDLWLLEENGFAEIVKVKRQEGQKGASMHYWRLTPKGLKLKTLLFVSLQPKLTVTTEVVSNHE